jgi:hypothetical protein
MTSLFEGKKIIREEIPEQHYPDRNQLSEIEIPLEAIVE